MGGFRINFFMLLLAGMALPAYGVSALQIMLDITPQGGVLKPPPGTYDGPVVIRKQLTLDGQGQVIIDGKGTGTVLTVAADGAEVRGLQLTRSGNSHDRVDAGILITADDSLVENNQITNSLFGIHLQQANGNTIRGNRISSLDETDPTLRGDGLRLWYSSENIIENNTITGTRDLVFTNAPDNRVKGNHISDSRIGMEFIFSPGNEVVDNSISHNVTGIVVIYSDALHIHGNQLRDLRKLTGFGLSIKESSQVEVSDNQFVHCAIGMVINSPIHPENITYVYRNLLAFNDAAMYFYGEKGGHVIQGNRFENNHTDVLVSAASSALANNWRGNFWDSYQGFDEDGDGIGDTPYSVHIYSDRLWMDRPMAKFYRGSPALELVDFMERLAPFSEPELILRDEAPRVSRQADQTR